MYVLPLAFPDIERRIWVKENALTASECDGIVGAVGPYERAQVGYPEARPDEARACDTAVVGWGREFEWLYERLGALAAEANNEAFGFDLFGVFESASVARYEAGGHHDWHIDLGTGPYACRKLTVLVQLSGRDEYRGGSFELHPTVEHPYPVLVDKGDAVVFPTWVPHAVQPLTEGTRSSLVAWVGGPPFR